MTGVRVGVVLLPEHAWREAKPRWLSLQDRGFAHGWTYDHLSWRTLADGPWYGTVPTLAAAAAVTDTLRLGTWVASPNFRHPVPFAKDLLTLDDISAGRIIAGVGSGGTGGDADVLGTPPLSAGARHRRFTQWLNLLQRLLREPDVSASSEFYTAVRARTIPAGARDRIELVVAAGGPKSVDLAAKFDGWATYGMPSRAESRSNWWTGVAELSARYTAATAGIGTTRYLSVDVPDSALGSIEQFTDIAGRAVGLGFTDIVVHWPRPAGVYAGDDRILDQLASRMTDGVLTT